jgi:hypothetical protein
MAIVIHFVRRLLAQPAPSISAIEYSAFGL